MTNPPSEPQYFNALFDALNQAETREEGRARSMPYALSIMLEGDGLAGSAIKKLAANILFFTSETNLATSTWHTGSWLSGNVMGNVSTSCASLR